MVAERNNVIADRNSQIDDARQNLNQVLIEKEKLAYELEMLKKQQVIANKPAENVHVVDSPQTIPERAEHHVEQHKEQHDDQHVDEHVQHIEPQKKEVPILEAAPLAK